MIDRQSFRLKVASAAQQSGRYLGAFFIVSILFQSIGFYFLFEQHFFEHSTSYWGLALINELFFTSLLGVFILICLMMNTRWLRGFLHGFLSLLLIFQLASLFYFAVTLEPIGATLLAFEADQMEMVASSFVVFKWQYLLLLLPPFLYAWLYRKLLNKKYSKSLALVLLFPLLLMPFFGIQINDNGGEFSSSGLIQNKTFYFVEGWMEQQWYHNPSSYEMAIDEYHRLEAQREFLGNDYPLLHKTTTSNPLAPFFSLGETPPNIVFILVESLSSSYSGKHADALSFTPFLDSLAEHGLYFENILSTGERTFSVLPSVISSLPHGKKGFTAANSNFPEHSSLSKWLFKNKYLGAFFYGGYARFDHMDLYMHHEGFHSIFDQKEYNYEGKDVNTSFDPVPFGIGDQQLFEQVLRKNDSLDGQNPFFDVILTLSMHYPFMIDKKEHYMKLAAARIAAKTNLSPASRKKYNKYLEPFSTFLYTDDAIKDYFKARVLDKSHQNTIYVILGDHMMTDIPQDSPIEKYRIPMLIYSPLLKRTKKINAVNSQLDLAPSLMQLIGNKYAFPMPEQVSWLGRSLDTSNAFVNTCNLLFMRNNRTCDDFLSGDYFVHEQKLYKIGPRMKLTPEKDNNKLKELIASRSFYEKLHAEVVTRNKFVLPTIRGKAIFDKKPWVLRFNDSTEYIELQKQVLKEDYKMIQINLNLSLNKGWQMNETDEAPLFVCTIKRDNEQYFWEPVDFEFEKKPLNEERQIVMNIEENMTFQLKKGDEISFMIWNRNVQNKSYQLLFKQFQMRGETQRHEKN